MSWNICSGLHRDLPRVVDAGVDVAVLCEAALDAPPPSLDLPDLAWHSVGDISHKGLVIAGLTTTLVPVEPQPPTSARWTNAAVTASGIGVVGIWSCPPRGRTYGAELEASVAAHETLLASRPCILAGDFNVSPAGSEDRRTGVLRRTFQRLADLGYESAYHQFTGERFGEESQPTYYHRYREPEPFHIDFVFLHRDLLTGLRSVEVGSYADWIAPTAAGWRHSDHAPLIIDFDC